MAIRHSRTYIVFAVGMMAGFTLSLVFRLFSAVDVNSHLSDADFAHGNIYNYDISLRDVMEGISDKQQIRDYDNNDEITESIATTADAEMQSIEKNSNHKSAPSMGGGDDDDDDILIEQELPPEQLILPKVEHPQSLNEILPSRHSVFIAVITSDKNLLSQTYAVQSTWGGDHDNVTFFVGKHSDITRAPHFMNIVKLHDAEEITTENSRRMLLHHVVHYISVHLLQHFRWFMIVGDNTYVRTDQVEVLVNNYDDNYNIYLGRPNRHFDKKEDDNVYNANTHYCIFNTGILLSRGLIRRLSPYISSCMEIETSLLSYEGDWEFGNCILKHLDVKCTQATEVSPNNASFCNYLCSVL